MDLKLPNERDFYWVCCPLRISLSSFFKLALELLRYLCLFFSLEGDVFRLDNKSSTLFSSLVTNYHSFEFSNKLFIGMAPSLQFCIIPRLAWSYFFWKNVEIFSHSFASKNGPLPPQAFHSFQYNFPKNVSSLYQLEAVLNYVPVVLFWKN